MGKASTGAIETTVSDGRVTVSHAEATARAAAPGGTSAVPWIALGIAAFAIVVAALLLR